MKILCSFCDKSFVDRPGLYYHAKKEHEGNIHECEHCQKRFKKTGEFKSHVKSMHSKPTEKYKCNFCEEGFSKKKDLKAHIIQTHENPSKNETFPNETFTTEIYPNELFYYSQVVAKVVIYFSST